MSDVRAEVLGTGARVNLESFVGVVGEIDLVKDLRRFVLDRFNFDKVRGVFPLTDFERFLKPLHRIDGDRMCARTKKCCQLLDKDIIWR